MFPWVRLLPRPVLGHLDSWCSAFLDHDPRPEAHLTAGVRDHIRVRVCPTHKSHEGILTLGRETPSSFYFLCLRKAA